MPDGSPCSTYWGLTRLGSSTDSIAGVAIGFISSSCVQRGGGASFCYLVRRLSYFIAPSRRVAESMAPAAAP